MWSRSRFRAVAVAFVLIVGGCGAPDDGEGSAPVPVASPTTTESATTVPVTSSVPVSTEPDAEASTTTTLPGLPFDAIAGTVAEVVKVAHDEIFSIRTAPGDDEPVAASYPPLTELVLTGRGTEIERDGIFVPWVEVTAGETTGWISRWVLAYPAPPRDITDEVVAVVGERPTAPTMLDLGVLVVGSMSQVPPPEVVLVAEPGPGPTAEVVYDVFPDEVFGDDASWGSRFLIVGRQVAATVLPATGFATPLGFELVSVEVRDLCARGVSATSGRCI